MLDPTLDSIMEHMDFHGFPFGFVLSNGVSTWIYPQTIGYMNIWRAVGHIFTIGQYLQGTFCILLFCLQIIYVVLLKFQFLMLKSLPEISGNLAWQKPSPSNLSGDPPNVCSPFCFFDHQFPNMAIKLGVRPHPTYHKYPGYVGHVWWWTELFSPDEIPFSPDVPRLQRSVRGPKLNPVAKKMRRSAGNMVDYTSPDAPCMEYLPTFTPNIAQM